jgi:hypothetical protein
MLVFVDETGCNTNQQTDGQVGGQKFVLPLSYKACLVNATTDIHFTVLCFNAGTGQPIMCAIILKSELDMSKIPLNWKYGIDITKYLRIEGSDDDEELFQNSSGLGEAMQGGTRCLFQGKLIPCFVCTSPKASISSSLLAEILRFIDSYGVFDRSGNKKPVLILDGHHSRFDLPFLDYIHDENNKWVVCIGVPYGTHFWQVADSAQLNGAFKTKLTAWKRKFF